MGLVGHVARIGNMRNAYKVLVRKPGGKRPLEISRRRWEDNIIIYLRETGQEDVKCNPKCSPLVQNRAE